jgi:hypothetical protein
MNSVNLDAQLKGRSGSPRNTILLMPGALRFGCVIVCIQLCGEIRVYDAENSIPSVDLRIMISTAA